MPLFSKIKSLILSESNTLGSRSSVSPISQEEIIQKVLDYFIESDFPLKLSTSLSKMIGEKIKKNSTDIDGFIKDVIYRVLLPEFKELEFKGDTNESILKIHMVVGVNGAGKTTFIPKLANRLKADGEKIIVAGCDTFRTSAVEQLEEWLSKIGIDFFSLADSSPSTVSYKAIEYAKREKADRLIIDTAGRLPSNDALMKELGKIYTVSKKSAIDIDIDVWQVLDATNGQSAIEQVKKFNSYLPLTGIILTKVEGLSQGGFILGLKELNLPVLFLSHGETIDTIKNFSAESYLEFLLDSFEL
ncbi:MAG: hypothetical protein JJV93_00695 [Alphaproteobacteria bacterium]|nr:hypothetical protein [Alphaproteobacteria bacterium]MBL0717771.1 hypothetical protein [Alphaproteobacteria bacterium]